MNNTKPLTSEVIRAVEEQLLSPKPHIYDTGLLAHYFSCNDFDNIRGAYTAYCPDYHSPTDPDILACHEYNFFLLLLILEAEEI